MYRKVEIRVPATTANLGPGFDCLGMALDLWNTIELELDSDGIQITGEGKDTKGNVVKFTVEGES